MTSFILQTVLPFILSALVVIIITIIAEKYGTKVGGILGTIPSTIVIAFIFISLNKDVFFASQSAVVVPAEMAINLVFLVLVSILVYRSLSFALFFSLFIWGGLTTALFFSNIDSILLSIVLYALSLVFCFIYLEKIRKIESHKKVKVHYTKKKIVLRGLLAGTVIATAVFLSTMAITYLEHGPGFTSGFAKSMIFGSQTVMSYVIAVHFLYPKLGLVYGTVISFLVSLVVAMILLKLRKNII